MTELSDRYNSLLESVNGLCATKNIVWTTENRTHWINFIFYTNEGPDIKYELNRMRFIEAGSNAAILLEINDFINKHYLELK